jgi:hypothetical protein
MIHGESSASGRAALAGYGADDNAFHEPSVMKHADIIAFFWTVRSKFIMNPGDYGLFFPF